MCEEAPRRREGETDASALEIKCSLGGACCPDALRLLTSSGCAVLTGVLNSAEVANAARALEPLLEEASSSWDAVDDSLQPSFSRRKWGVTRVPRVNSRKKNVHFSQECHLHSCLSRLAVAAGLAELLSSHLGRRVSLSETGLSLTLGGGSGMEWHADGGSEEATVLMSLADVPAAQGALGVVPRSHVAYVEGQDPAVVLENLPERVWHAYKAGCPVVVDARTLHAAADNMTEQLRCVVWMIFNAEQGTEVEGS